jgi:hypothetical protein
MSPSPPGSAARQNFQTGTGRGAIPIKKESWRPAGGQRGSNAQSSWTPHDQGGGNRTGPSWDTPSGPSRGPRGQSPPSSAETERRNFKIGSGNRYNRLEAPRNTVGGGGPTDRSWASRNQQGQPLSDGRGGAPPAGVDRNGRWRAEREEDVWADSSRGPEAMVGRGHTTSSFRPGEPRRSWGAAAQPVQQVPDRTRMPPRNDQRNGRASPDYGVGGRAERSDSDHRR